MASKMRFIGGSLLGSWLLGCTAFTVGCGEAFSSPGGDGAASSGGSGATGGVVTSSSTSTAGAGGTTASTTITSGGAGGGIEPSPPPVELATDQDRPWGIAVDDDAVYWTNEGDGQVMSVALLGGQPQPIYFGGQQLRGIDVRANRIAWADRGRDHVCIAVLGEGSQACAGDATSDNEDVAIDETLTAYFTAPGTATVGSWNGSTNGMVASGQNLPLGIALSSTHLYWANSSTQKILRSSLAQHAPTLYADSSGPAREVVAGALGVFWTVPDAGLVEGIGAANVPVTIAAEQGEPWGIAADAAQIYWTNRTTGEVRCALPDGTNMRDIATGMTEPLGIAVDHDSVYWIERGVGSGAGSVWKAGKP